MSNHTSEQRELINAWQAVYDGAGKALQWVEGVRGNAKRLDAEADSFNFELHRTRNLAKSLGRASGTPMCIGFFGLSQAGKSYLISALAADSAGNLETDFGNQRLEFIKHVNPVGGGKEATGLVTRFSRRAQPSPDAAYPVELRLFQEIELAKILANIWFGDFDQERVDYALSSERIQALLHRFDGRESGRPVPGVNSDDVVALCDYLAIISLKADEKLKPVYWPRVLKVAPYLSVAERAELFSVLWGEEPTLTQTYVRLAQALHALGLPSTVFAPLSALVRSDGERFVQSNSIMNVDILSRLGSSAQDSSLEVRPLVAGELKAPVLLPSAQLAALTTELIFRLVNEPGNPIVNDVDLLDFPGYRSRSKLAKISEAEEVASDGSIIDPIGKLLLRGKVAYLFERYTDEQEMNALVVCTSSFKQSEVVSVAPVLERWINKTQGEEAEERQGHASGLIWALTMCDGWISSALNMRDPALFPESCDNMLKLTIVERFGSQKWMKQWGNAPFNNTYLVRKPRLDTSFITLSAAGQEESFTAMTKPMLEQLGETFSKSELVNRHVAHPAQAWKAMLELNDGGISRFSDSFTALACLEFKLRRIADQLHGRPKEVQGYLNSYFQLDGEGALAIKQAQANKIVRPLVKRMKELGELLHYMALPDEHLRDLYLSGDFESAVQSGQAAQADSHDEDDGFDIFSGSVAKPTAVAAPEQQSHEHRFAKAAFQAWVGHLRELGDRQGLLKLLGLPRDVIDALVDELVTTAYRLGLPEQLSQALLKRAQSGVRRDNLVQRQVLTTQLVLNDFVAWFGHMYQPPEKRPKGLLGNKDALFAFYRDVITQQLPQLPAQATDQTAVFANDWISGVALHTQANAGHSEGRDITPEQNAALGQVIRVFQAR